MDIEKAISCGLSKQVKVTSMLPLTGGMINKVFLARIDISPYEVVLKVSEKLPNHGFRSEFETLAYLKEKTGLPVPTPYFYFIDGKVVPFSILGMEKLPGVNLGIAKTSYSDSVTIEEEMAIVLAQLHTNTRDYFGSCLEPGGQKTWIEIFKPHIVSHLPEIRDKLDHKTTSNIESILDRLEGLISRPCKPTLVHGDIWATNVMVKQSNNGYHLSGFIDPAAQFADVEYELAYLSVFNTVGKKFFEVYTRYHQIDVDFEIRRPIYWLNTMMLHVKLFGDYHYVEATKNLALRIINLIRL